MKKKALAILHNPKALYDFLWYYVEYGQNYDWDALIYKDRISEKILSRVRVFNNIYIRDMVVEDRNTAMAALFLQMIGYRLINKKEKLAKIVLEQYTDNKEYDIYVVSCAASIIGGLTFLLGKEKHVIILQDGNGDYTDHTDKWSKEARFNAKYVASYFLGKMGYADLTWQYNLDSWGNCEKCVEYPEKFPNRDKYKEIKEIRKFSGNNQVVYDSMIRSIFLIDIIEDIDVILYTSTLSDFSDDITGIIRKTVDYINRECKGKKLALKYHPRDFTKYEFDSSVNVTIVDRMIPAEIIEKKLGRHKRILMYTSTLLQNISSDDYVILYYTDLESANGKNPYKKCIEQDIKQWKIDDSHIVKL